MRVPLIAVLLAGCFTPEAPPFVVDELEYHNPFTEYPDVKLRPYTYDGLTCPDGSDATVYAVFRENPPAPAPVVILLHAGSFDYLLSPTSSDPLSGPRYQEDDRLTGDWASRKVFETLGLLEGTDVDVNSGILPASLANEGAFTLIPANCWGDLWHNESGYAPNAEGEGFARNGRALLWATAGMFSQDEATATLWQNALGFEAPVELDTSAISLAGLGEGGRGVAELLVRPTHVASVAGSSSELPPIRAVVVDSPMDNLNPVVADAATFGRFVTGLERLYGDLDTADIGQYSLNRWVSRNGVPGSLRLVWSSADPEVPVSTLEGLVSQATGGAFVATDTQEAAHILVNSDVTLGRDAAERLVGQ